MKVLEAIVNILTTIIKSAVFVAIIGFCAAIAIFILTIIMPENVEKALEIVRGILGA